MAAKLVRGREEDKEEDGQAVEETNGDQGDQCHRKQGKSQPTAKGSRQMLLVRRSLETDDAEEETLVSLVRSDLTR